MFTFNLQPISKQQNFSAHNSKLSEEANARTKTKYQNAFSRSSFFQLQPQTNSQTPLRTKPHFAYTAHPNFTSKHRRNGRYKPKISEHL